jgi:hypothetical protein
VAEWGTAHPPGVPPSTALAPLLAQSANELGGEVMGLTRPLVTREQIVHAQRRAATRSRLLLARSVLKEYTCEKLGLPSAYSKFYDRIGCIYIHIPKCAGTSVTKVLYGASPWHYRASDLFNINPIKFLDCYRFATVRDPFARLYSIYRYASVDVQRFWFSPLKPIVGISFAQFVDALDEEIVACFPFLSTQVSYTSIGSLRNFVDIIKVEDLPAAMQPVYDRIPSLANVTALRLSVTTNKPRMQDVYTADMRRKVARLYQDDFAAFGY